MPLNNTVKIIRAPVEVRRHGFTLPLLLTRVETATEDWSSWWQFAGDRDRKGGGG